MTLCGVRGAVPRAACPLAGLSSGWDAEPSARLQTPLPAPYTRGEHWERCPRLVGAAPCPQPL